MTEGAAFKLKYLEEQYETLTSLGSPDGKGVFLCKDSRSGDIVVKKYISPETCAVYERLTAISSPHLAHICDMAFDQQMGLVVEEFISGITLRKYISRHGLPDQKYLYRIVCDLCDALSEPHRLGIVHRDIKPDNIIISSDGVLKVIDFGIARIVKRELSQDTSFLGTPSYAPPEQFGFSQTDCRSDIYSIGILMSELILGEVLPVDLLRKQRSRLGALAPVILKCIDLKPEQRFQNVSELRLAIQEIASPLGIPAAAAGYAPTSGKFSYQSFIPWLPGFRTNNTAVNVMAALGYLFLLLSTVAMMTAEDYLCSMPVFLLELLAVILYLWAAALIALNIGNWDRKIFPFSRLPHAVMVTIRIFLWITIFYLGMSLEEYVKYTLMGLVRPV